ncbi:F-box protein: endocytic membrane traffic, recycling ReCYcling 1 [Geranomyces variabilis]|nr:F-box protein: endocytic membrane traffic, recycling ReCYcling 1 [Geranomyces variabilis]
MAPSKPKKGAQSAAAAAAAAGPPKTIASLPPDLIIRAFTFLPVADLSAVARVSRRFKILAYNDDVYDPKLRALGITGDGSSGGLGAPASGLANPDSDTDNADGGLVDMLSTRLRQMPGGDMLPASTKYLETGTLWSSLVDTDAAALASSGQQALPAAEAKENNSAATDASVSGKVDSAVVASPSLATTTTTTTTTTSATAAASSVVPEGEMDISMDAPIEASSDEDLPDAASKVTAATAPAEPSSPVPAGDAAAATTPASPVSPQQQITSTLTIAKPTLIIGHGGLQGASGKTANALSVGGFKKQASVASPSAFFRGSGKTGRELFRQMYTQLCPYFLDFRKRQKDSKVFKDFKDLSQVAVVLRKLKLFSDAHFILDCDDIHFAIETTIEWFESMLLGQFERAYDSKNISEMQRNAWAAYNLNGGHACVQLFISKNPVFFDPTFNPSLISSKLPAGGAAVGYTLADDFAKFSDYTLNNCRAQARIIAHVFPPEADALTSFVNKVFEDSVAEYLSAVLAAAKEREGVGIYLHTLATGIHCCMQFADYISVNDAAVPVQTDKLKASVVALVKPYTKTYMKQELEYMSSKFENELEKWANRKDAKKKKAGATAKYIADQDQAQAHKRQVMNTMKSIMFAPVALGKMVTGLGGNNKVKPHLQSLLDNAEPVTTLPVQQEDNVTYHLDDDNSLNGLVSLELCLHLMHTNKEALGRVLVVTSATDPTKIRTNVEKVFCALLSVIGPNHIKPAFDTAISRLSTAKLSDAQDEKAVSPDSLQFFELVHIADLIQQMVEVYYQEDVKSWIDESDFLADIVVDKKAFERLLDDCVASGMDKAIQVLVNQVDYILLVEQKKEDYNPLEKDVVVDLKPTLACRRVIDCLNSHAKILYGVAEKNTMEVFFGEVGTRIFNVICKNIKRLQISQTGAMQLILDLNTFYTWSTTLRVSSVKKMFEVLKELGNLFLADGGDELRKLVHDLPRYQGQLRIEEVYELLASRTDYKKIQKYVETKECCIQ